MAVRPVARIVTGKGQICGSKMVSSLAILALKKGVPHYQTSYAQAQGGHPQYLVPAAGVLLLLLLLKLATFDRIVIEAKQHLLSIT